MASKSLLRNLGLTPMIGTPIIGNVGKVDSYVASASEINDDNGESRDSYHSVSDEPPSYSATVPPRSYGRKPITELPISINLQAYRLPQSALSQDHVQLTTTSSTYFENAQSLVQLVRDQALLPPRPLINIKGSHSEYGKAYGADKIDFELSLDMTPLLVRDELHQASHLQIAPFSGNNGVSITDEKHSLKGNRETDLELWADKFCRDPAVSKSFVLERKITNWDTAYLTAQIHSLVASTKFQGDLSVTFPLTYSTVIVHAGALAIHKSEGSWVEKINKAMSGSSLSEAVVHSSTKTYPSVQSIWQYASAAPGEKGRECVVQSEQEWIQVWKDVVRKGVLDGKHTKLGIEDWREVQMVGVPAEKEKAWGVGRQW